MKTSWTWLSQWVDLQGLKPDEVAKALTMAGLEIEQVQHLGQGHEKIVVAKITQITPHPKADRLVLCQVDVGQGEGRQIVCGATNMKPGDLVPAALPGSQPPAFDFEIGERKMRGELSQGMLCAGEELGLDDGVDGLLILPPELTVGQPIFEALGLKDTVFEIGVTPNRADCFSHHGVALEIGAAFGRQVKPLPEVPTDPAWLHGQRPQAGDQVSLQVEDTEGCPHYSFAIVRDAHPQDSPPWLRSRLAAVGVRSINTLVDMTNFVMFDLGQPLHAFDLDKIEGASIVVRRAKPGETMVGIDHKEYTLDPHDLVIADAAGPVAIAGVMGGERTEVTQATKNVLIECAYFEPTVVRKAAKRHGMHTESSHRFERGVDPGRTLTCLSRALDLTLQLHADSQAKAARGVVYKGREVADQPVILLPFERVNRILGLELSPALIAAKLASIGLPVISQDEHALGVRIPSRRRDLERPIDLIEEVARLIGFDTIPALLPQGVMGRTHTPRATEDAHVPTIVPPDARQRRRRQRALLLDAGIHEALNFSFMSAKELHAAHIPQSHPLHHAWPLANPLSQDLALMRTTLLPSLLRNLHTNLAQRQRDVALFEFGRTYHPDQATEPRRLGILLTGRRRRHWSGEEAWDFFGLKGLIEALGRGLRTEPLRWTADDSAPYLHPGVQAVWQTPQGDEIARVGRLHPALEQAQDLPKGVLWAQVNLDPLDALGPHTPTFSPLSKYPTVTRDFALVQDRSIPYAQIPEAIHKLAQDDAQFGAAFESLEVFDVYQGEQIEADKRSVALQVAWTSLEGTMTDQDIVALSTKLLQALERSAHAVLRA